MEIFELDAKNHTPYIKLDHTNGVMEFKGRSTPENSVEFYDPVNKWLIQFINEAVTIPVIVKLKFEYFNTSSSKCILDVLKKFAELKKTGADVKETKKEAITSVLENVKGMPMMNLVRNLRNILTLAPEKVDDAVKQLTTKGKVLNSKLLPFRFATAYAEIEAVGVKTYNPSEIVFENDIIPNMAEMKAKILKGLETALEYSCENIPSLVGNTAVLVDHSGSVRGDGGGSSKVSAFSTTSTAMIGNLFGSMLAYSQRNVYVGLFGDRLISVPMDRKIGLLEFNKESFRKGGACGGATENGLYIFLDEAIRNKTKVDNLVIFSDMVIGKGGSGGWDGTSRAGFGTFQELFKKFKAVNPQCNTVCVNMRATGGKSVFNKALNVTEVAGWSDKSAVHGGGPGLIHTLTPEASYLPRITNCIRNMNPM